MHPTTTPHIAWYSRGFYKRWGMTKVIDLFTGSQSLKLLQSWACITRFKVTSYFFKFYFMHFDIRHIMPTYFIAKIMIFFFIAKIISFVLVKKICILLSPGTVWSALHLKLMHSRLFYRLAKCSRKVNWNSILRKCVCSLSTSGYPAVWSLILCGENHVFNIVYCHFGVFDMIKFIIRVKVEQVWTAVIEWRWGLICIFMSPHILNELKPF